jgi:hypothetical protein
MAAPADDVSSPIATGLMTLLSRGRLLFIPLVKGYLPVWLATPATEPALPRWDDARKPVGRTSGRMQTDDAYVGVADCSLLIYGRR